MRLLVVTGLNRSLARAKLVPLLRTAWVRDVTWASTGSDPEVPGVEFVPLTRTGSAPYRTAALLLAVLRTAVRRKPDLVMAYNIIPFGIAAYLVSRLLRIPLGLNVIGGPVEIEGGGYQTENRVLSRLQRPSMRLERLLIRLLQAADFVTTTGTHTKAFLAAKGVAADRIFPISSVIDPVAFCPRDQPRRYDLVCISALIARKRVDLLLDLVGELRARRPQIRAAIVGKGDLQPALEAQARRLGLDDHVDFLGFRDEVRDVLWASRVFVMTSRHEGLPLSLMESMACGVVPVVGDFGDVTDLVEDGHNGRLARVAHPADYPVAILELLEDEAVHARYAARAVASVRAGYTIPAATAKWDALYGARLARPTGR